VRFARAAFAVLVVFLFAGLTPAAYADPPDPIWLAGYWDDDDFDDAIVFIMATSAIDALPPADGGTFFVLVASLDALDPVAQPAAPRVAISARAPPATAPPSC
jgi:hypothetical protein